MIRNYLVHRCLIDDGSSVDVLYLDVLEKMRISTQSLRAAASPLHGFTRDSIFPEESIELAVLFGEEPTRSTVLSNFMVVKGRYSYNVIVGRPTLVAMKEVTSIYHICYTTSVRSAPTDSSGKRTAEKAGLIEGETLTIWVPKARCELDPRLSAQ